MSPRKHVVVRVPRDEFARRFGADATSLPRNVCLAGWSAEIGEWFASPERVVQDPDWGARVMPTLRFMDEAVRPSRAPGSFWFLLCFHDGWRERIAASPASCRGSRYRIRGSRATAPIAAIRAPS